MGKLSRKEKKKKKKFEQKGNAHLPRPPLHLLDDIQAAVHDELVHVSRLFAEPRLPVAALLRRPELVLEERVVLRPDDDEVVRHRFALALARPRFVGR